MAKKRKAQNNVQPAPAPAPAPAEAQAEAPAEAQAPAEAPAEAQAEANANANESLDNQQKELSEEQKNAIICNTTKNQLDEIAKRVRKEVNSLNGALKALCNEKIYQDLFNALGLESHDKIRLSVMQSIAYASEDGEGKFIAATLKPVARFDNTTYYKVVKLNWFSAISQATYRLARGLARVQNVIADSFYIKNESNNTFSEVTESATIAEIEKQIKCDKYEKAIARVNKLKLEF